MILYFFFVRFPRRRLSHRQAQSLSSTSATWAHPPIQKWKTRCFLNCQFNTRLTHPNKEADKKTSCIKFFENIFSNFSDFWWGCIICSLWLCQVPSLKQFYRTFLPSQPMMETEEKPSEQMEMSRTSNWRRPASVNIRSEKTVKCSVPSLIF